MIFSSITFLFLFLPVIFLLVFVSGKRFRNLALLAGSLFFYAWGEGIFCSLLIGSMVVNYFLALRIERSSSSQQKFFLVLGVITNLSPLFILKYAGFFAATLSSITGFEVFDNHATRSIYLPAGISFFTFQAISYLVDVYRKIVPAEQRIINCGLYISMFPQLIAGPIVRYHDIAKQLSHRVVTRSDFAEGAERFILGLGKKVLLADPLGSKADMIFLLPMAELSTPAAWLGAICFSLQIYYDFSGYSDMAIGLGRMFGFRFPENFNYPYISRSMREFWRRWHISLSTWLRDYLYIPLGGNRKGTSRTYINLLIVFLLCGLWHGANWTFIVWGGWHGLFLIFERLFPGRKKTVVRGSVGWLYTSLVVLVGWVIFRSPDLASAMDYLVIMGGGGLNTSNPEFAQLMTDSKFHVEFILGLILATPAYRVFKVMPARPDLAHQPFLFDTALSIARGSARLFLFCSVAYFSSLAIAARAYSPFLYFQF